MTLKKCAIVFILLFFINGILFGQSNNLVPKNNLIPPSPTSSSLAKYAEWPISLYTGTPQVDIPLYTLTSKNVSVPISLSYHASGHRVDDYASWVGLGWSLNGGGVITRTVRGLPDDQSSDGYFSTRTLLRNPENGYDNMANWAIFHNQALGILDSQPDVYMFSAMGRSFKFFIDSNYNVQSIPKNAVKITLPGGVNAPFLVGSQWIAQLEDGTKLYFGGTGGIENTENFNNAVSSGVDFISSWYLKKVVPAVGGEINLYYDTENYMTTNTLSVSEFTKIVASIELPPERNDSYSQIQGLRLSRIETENGLVKFVKKPNQRKDLANSYALDSIKVYQLPDRKLIKQYVIGYDDQGSSRLRLDHVKEIAPDNTESRKQWSFVYSPTKLPERGSFSQDHWGYYNGILNTTLLPFVRGLDPRDLWGDRESYFPASSAEMLTQINYPTGGNSKFIYEPHSYTHQTTDAGLVSTNVELLTTDPKKKKKSIAFSKNSAGEITLDYMLERNPNENDPLYVKISIVDSAGGNEVFVRTPSKNGLNRVVFNLFRGNYILKIFSPDMSNTYCRAKLSWMSEGPSRPVNRLVGGVRIKEILDFDGKDTLRKSYSYDDAFCAAPLTNDNYVYGVEVLTIDPCVPGIGDVKAIHNLTGYWARSSFAKGIPGATSGGPIGYGKVKVLYGENGQNGTEESVFSTSPKDLVNQRFPFPPSTSFDYKRGLLMSHKIKNSAGVLLKSTTNTYDFIPSYIQNAYNTGFRVYNRCYSADSGLGVSERSQVVFARFADHSEWVQKTSQVDSTYDAAGNATAVRKDYYYDNPVHQQLTRTQSSTSTGKVLTEVSTFADDYAGGAAFLAEMKLNHQIGLPIEQVVYQQNGTELKILSGKITEYKAGGKALIDKIYSLDLSSPADLTSFKFSSRIMGFLPYEQAPNLYSKDNRYREVMYYNTYDIKGNPLTIIPKDGVPVSYQWSYNYQYPVAELQNATTGEFYYEGFEQDAAAARGLAHTGSKYSINKTVNWVRPNSRNYLISYWYRTGGVWKLQSDQAYTGNSFTLSGGDAYDDIRIIPSDAQMKTYTYRPLIGMSSMTDQKGQTLYYEYDAFQRLKNVKDQQMNIVQNYAYHHLMDVQLNPVVYANRELSKVFYTACPEGQEGKGVHYFVIAGKYTSTVDQEDVGSTGLR